MSKMDKNNIVSVLKESSQNPLKVALVEDPLEDSFYDVVQEFLGCSEGSYPVRVRLDIEKIMVSAYSMAVKNTLAADYRKATPPKGHSFRITEIVNGNMPLQLSEYLEAKNGEKFYVHVSLDMGKYSSGVFFLYVRNDHFHVASEFISNVRDNLAKISPKLSFSGDGNILETQSPVDWDDVVLPHDVKANVETGILSFLQKSDLFIKSGIPFKRGILLYGPPGNGKTLMCRLIASKAKASVICTTPKNISEMGSIAGIYNLARVVSPSIIFLEDLDLIGQERFGSTTAGLLGELLNQMDGYQTNNGVITIATTNKLMVLDKVLANRPGRFDVSVELGNPTQENRIALFELFTRSIDLHSEIDFHALSQSTEGYSCAKIREVVTRTRILSADQVKEIKPLTTDDFLETVKLMESKKSKVGFANGQSADLLNPA